MVLYLDPVTQRFRQINWSFDTKEGPFYKEYVILILFPLYVLSICYFGSFTTKRGIKQVVNGGLEWGPIPFPSPFDVHMYPGLRSPLRLSEVLTLGKEDTWVRDQNIVSRSSLRKD